ncbi:TRAP transporter permease DctQ [Vandammella animalimorsus]|uniref:TRAP transporter small permease protein n=1 Tax=Vandammella animalimorsus TaxID=2029117 RepID=A0A2A2AKI9_9BURK|nr:TRAP transporter small permease subunit [Vandammella animalimorsus]RRD66620.1 TRAP transporter small permease subunit [Comamonadaceae bacterium OH2310_COT-174]PAT30678.1 TRAP transporter permease DctQ [Vandammella animalimorsus]PAT39080.1 TRAP transporter permease DctQ [Vandammella animalimorsus]PAX17851.1 TRAP transporter permease DctQ [Vandammella animalimorsus]PAX20005.1 TRAP transporter permease DctQ [Vandammella animalimorsus]
MRKTLDALYAASLWLAGLSMIGVLLMVLLSIASRLLGFSAAGSDAYAGYAMAGAGFLALAGTLKSGEHIRVTLVLGMLRGRARRALEIAALAIASLLSAFLAYYSARLVWQSYQFNDISTASDATPMWIPQLLMAAGTLVLSIAFIDELLLALRGQSRLASLQEERHHE